MNKYSWVSLLQLSSDTPKSQLLWTVGARCPSCCSINSTETLYSTPLHKT